MGGAISPAFFYFSFLFSHLVIHSPKTFGIGFSEVSNRLVAIGTFFWIDSQRRVASAHLTVMNRVKGGFNLLTKYATDSGGENPCD
jgi:hypothetical protein